jgi:hypothetical protein
MPDDPEVTYRMRSDAASATGPIWSKLLGGTIAPYGLGVWRPCENSDQMKVERIPFPPFISPRLKSGSGHCFDLDRWKTAPINASSVKIPCLINASDAKSVTQLPILYQI